MSLACFLFCAMLIIEKSLVAAMAAANTPLSPISAAKPRLQSACAHIFLALVFPSSSNSLTTGITAGILEPRPKQYSAPVSVAAYKQPSATASSQTKPSTAASNCTVPLRASHAIILSLPPVIISEPARIRQRPSSI